MALSVIFLCHVRATLSDEICPGLWRQISHVTVSMFDLALGREGDIFPRPYITHKLASNLCLPELLVQNIVSCQVREPQSIEAMNDSKPFHSTDSNFKSGKDNCQHDSRWGTRERQ